MPGLGCCRTLLRGGLVSKAHRRVYHSTRGLRAIKKRREKDPAQLEEACNQRRLEDPSHIMYQLNGFRKSTPPKNRQKFVIYYYLIKYLVDGFVGGVTV